MPTKPSTTHLGVRLTLAERRTIARAARLCKLSVSAWVRRLTVTSAERLIALDKDAKAEGEARRLESHYTAQEQAS